MRSAQPNAIAALALVAAATGCAKKPPPAPPPPEVGYVVVRTEPVTLAEELPGRTSAYVVSDVRPQVNGVIRARLFTEGADVRAGQTLYEIDPAPYRAALAQAEAQAANARANVATQRLRAERYGDLVRINAVSRQEADDARAGYGQAQANVALADAQVRTARINLGYTRVSSPVSGRIGRASVTQGGLATAGQTQPLATVQQLDPIYVDVVQSADALLRLKRGIAGGELQGAGAQSAQVRLTLSDGSDYPLEGRLRFSEAQVDPTTGSVTLRALFANPDRTLLPGMYVRARLIQAVNAQGILAPQAAVSRNEKGEATAMVVSPDGKAAQPRIIRTSRPIGDKWLVSDGLKPGDRLITEGLVKLRGPGPIGRAVPAGSRPGPPPGAPAAGGGDQRGAGSAGPTPSSKAR